MRGFFLLTLYLAFFNLFGQDSKPTSDLKFGMDCAVATNALGFLNVLPSATISKGKYFFFAGPGFFDPLGYDHQKKIVGVQSGCNFYPFKIKRIFNLFLSYDVNYSIGNYQLTRHAYLPTDIKLKDIRVMSFENYLGAGFNIKMGKWFYFRANAGLGLIYYGEKVNVTCLNGSKRSYEYKPDFYAGYFYPFPESYKGNKTAYENNEHKKLIATVKIGLGFNIPY